MKVTSGDVYHNSFSRPVRRTSSGMISAAGSAAGRSSPGDPMIAEPEAGLCSGEPENAKSAQISRGLLNLSCFYGKLFMSQTNDTGGSRVFPLPPDGR